MLAPLPGILYKPSATSENNRILPSQYPRLLQQTLGILVQLIPTLIKFLSGKPSRHPHIRTGLQVSAGDSDRVINVDDVKSSPGTFLHYSVKGERSPGNGHIQVRL